MNYINYNGNLILNTDATVSVKSFAFKYGYGIFETILAKNGSMPLLKYHYNRLYDGLKKMNFAIPEDFTIAELEKQILRTIEINSSLSICRVRLQFFSLSTDFSKLDSIPVKYIIECTKIGDENIIGLNEFGFNLGITDGLVKSIDTLSNLKTCNSIIYLLAAQQAQQKNWYDALLINSNGNIIESSNSNVFIVKNNVIYTPPLSEGCVAGVMRRRLFETCNAIIETQLNKNDFLNADEIFLTNAIRCVKWIGRFENRDYGNEFIIAKFSKFAYNLFT